MLAFIFAVLAAVSPKPRYVYDLSPTEYQAGSPSCHSERLRKEKIVVRVWDDDHVVVNHTRWKGSMTPDGRLMYLYFQVEPKAYTYLVLKLYTNDRGAIGTLTLNGRRENGSVCSDSVELKGERL